MSSCHSSVIALPLNNNSQIALVGNPNVGKSVLFHRLTGRYVVVSNYPGTTVGLSRGSIKALQDVQVVDTPGIVSFPARSEDEAVTAQVLLNEKIQAIVQVGDAKNIRRTLHLTVQLVEMGLPLVLALNMVDEAQARGLEVDSAAISEILSIPVINTIATRGEGILDLQTALKLIPQPTYRIDYPPAVETTLQEMEKVLPESPITKRALGLLWLSADQVSEQWLGKQLSSDQIQHIISFRSSLEQTLGQPIDNVIHETREKFVETLAQKTSHAIKNKKIALSVKIGHLSTHPLYGLPILALVLYAMYWFVGVFGAGTLVGLIENDLFSGIINPWLTAHIGTLIPWTFLRELIFGQYGLWTMGMTYALALLFPIVTTFFICFGILEDSGYLPRLSVLANRIFTMMGLNGQAVLPMILGLGCVTMATMTTRIMTSKRDRILVTFLLALAVPCSAQLGVVMGLLAGISFTGTLVWLGVVLLVMFLVGWIAAKLMPGERQPLIVELPPLRMPIFSNVLIKTAARLEWYVKEALPLFIIGTLLLFVLDQLKLLPGMIHGLEPIVVNWLGLPAEAATAFLLGLMRRDFAATGLFVMESHGLLSPLQIVVSITTITLFIPCIASIFMMVKERGWKQATAMTVFIFPFAILIGGLLQRFLTLTGWMG
ncbi:MAG: ferrous iron transport protein B [Chloroflexi bacterium HGW-Chloroflexi-8]|nr:MAG: ferrous iron transport protein B [Chloroflexi bacterium HGW-Chloroflexi-8]